MPLASTAAENDALAGIVSAVAYASLHTATTGTTGAAEVSGGSYARVAVTLTAASGGSTGNNATLTFNVPAGTTITNFGLWTAATGGTFLIGGTLGSSQAFSTAGTYTISAGSLTVTAA